MTQSTTFSTSSAFPDVFSEALTAIFEQAQPAIVQVRTEGRGGGTGVIWHEDGRIITNHHVVARDGARIEVLLPDGRLFAAKVLHRNPRLDLALLKIEGDSLKRLRSGDSSKLRVGEWVFAIGHPWGQRWVVTAGIMSMMRTAKLADDLKMQYIQSDVELAPGNSGGPLLNADGEVVGINAMIFGGDLSVAIPSNVVNSWLAELPQRRVTLGVEITTVELPAAFRISAGIEQRSGVLVCGIRKERQAKYQDLFVGDVLLFTGNTPLPDNGALLNLLSKSEERERLSVKVLRGGEVKELEIGTLLVEQAE
ncbi:MAG TPA: trypsin-like peptidase domain-containing protein [Ktedonobacteraceae bacterium]|jgi:serine protease Do|nr:trypsin-like peptidase domain-containing protein [Ktedonobacteraceae bacterium]